MNEINDVRRFNRFYTRLIGLLDEHLPGSEFSLPEGRVMYELGTSGKQTAADLTRLLDIDKAQLSRILKRLGERRLVTSSVDVKHAKRKILALTSAGRRAFEQLQQGTKLRLEALLSGLKARQRRSIVASMHAIQAAFEDEDLSRHAVVLRPVAPGDLGWVIHRQAVLYAQEYRWDWTYEGLVSRILGDFAANFDPAGEDGWMAEIGDEIVGSIFLMKSEDSSVAKLRLLYVEPRTRGSGVGRLLVNTCIERARELGYKKLTLWTNDLLTAARRIYETTGFKLIEENAHVSFGQQLMGQTWALDL